MKWKEVLENPKYIGGDIEIVLDGMRYCGPIQQMKLSDDDSTFTFVREWCAKKAVNPASGDHMWDFCTEVDKQSVTFDTTVAGLPRVQDAGRLHFNLPHPRDKKQIMPTTVLPKGYFTQAHVNLVPALVRGLSPEPAVT